MNIFHIILGLLIFRTTAGSRSLDPKCTEKFPDCSNGRTEVNTACVNRGCGPKFKGCKELPPDAQFRQTILDKHNELRNKVASGGDTTGGNQAAANMMALSYDLALEFTAICHVHGCSMQHDSCRGTKTFPSAGQNLAMISKMWSRPVTDDDIDEALKPDTYKGMIQNWYDEIKKGDFTESIDNFVYNSATGHFTALVWAETSHIGCASAIDRSDNNKYTLYLTCNYAKAGNMRGDKIYIKGGACTKCPSGVSCNSKYTALCGEIDNKDVNDEENPYRADDKARGKETSIKVNIISINRMILLSIFLSLFK